MTRISPDRASAESRSPATGARPASSRGYSPATSAICRAGAASELLEKVAASGGNLLIVGRPGTGKTTLLKS